jgi:thioesterase domain-containing protein
VTGGAAWELSDVKRALLDLQLRQERGRRAREAGPLVPLQPAGDRPPLYFVHASSGSVFAYMPLASRLGGDQPFYGLEAPGLNAGEAPVERTEEMAARYVAAIRTAQPDGPYRLGGWSIGAIVALEMARQLLAAGEAVDRLVLLDSGWYRVDDPATPLKALRWFVDDVAHLAGCRPPEVEDVLALPAETRLRRLRERLVELGLVPAEVDQAAFERRAAVQTANTMGTFTFRPRPYPGEAVLLVAESCSFDVRWLPLVRGGLRVEVVPGNHYTILQPPLVDVVAARVRALLDGDVPAGRGAA